MKEITEKNKLIAEFMGFKTYPKNHYHCYPDIPKITSLVPPQHMRFHESYDWIMLAVEKIEDFHDGVEYQVVIYEDEVEIVRKSEPKWEIVVSVPADGSGKLINTWNAVVEFIEWYNQNKES